ncbi:MAG: hypothetical protein B7Z38_02130 [Rhodobacterales bacterium 12-64-8]|nr:MAG: hypothetical protein B7Z38_02130 [Rhodobacterales bacterium 12-64-8]OYX51322.1 MAG: hypothetical protein B7Y90_01475 [Alphaproteobacteria bacterium 32-64-14]
MENAARLGFDPLIPWAALWALVAVAVVLWGVYVHYRGKSWLFRALALTILAVALSNPLWIEEQREPLKDIVAVVMDRSESMNFRGRTETAEAAYGQLRRAIEDDENLELRVAETDPGADGTDMYIALQSAMSDAPRDRIAGVVMITDGQIHDIPEDTKDSGQFGPIHAMIVGGEDEIDRNIEIQQAPSFSIIDQRVEMRIQVNDPAAERVNVGVTINGEARPDQTVPVGEPTMIGFTLTRRGENLVVLSVDGIPNELTLANNLASARISGVQDRLRVLLVTGEPHAGARVWRDLLKSDPAVDLVHFTILRPPEKGENLRNDELALIAFPKAQLFREKLDEFDLVIFDHELRPAVLEEAYLDRVARYVERGGALLIASGPPYPGAYILYNTPLGGVLPGRATGEMVDGKFTPQLTTLGKRHSVTATLPTEGWGPWMRYMKMERGESESLMQTPDGAPLLLLNRVGQGRVASVMSDQLWLWARGYEGGGPYAELIRRTAHWLMKEPELEEELLKIEAGASPELKATLQTMSDNPAKLSVQAPDGIKTEYDWAMTSPGHYQTSLPAQQLGLYRAVSGKLSAVTLRGPTHPREYLDLRATSDKVQPLATATLGGVFRLGADGTPTMPRLQRVGERGNASGNDWFGLRERGAYAVRATESTTLLPGVVGMLLAALFMMLAWRREGR